MTPLRYLPRDLPRSLEPLMELALDLRWTWSHAADQLWRTIDSPAWESTRNPWLILHQLPDERLAELARDEVFRDELAAVLKERHRHAAAPAADRGLTRPVAYFSMEYAVGEAIPFYAGGLGVLAGDHLKAASDLGIPMVAVGLMYQGGYFRQMVDRAGRQIEMYPYNDPTTLPVSPLLADSGAWLMVSLQLPGRRLDVRVWRAQVGRVELLLLDSNIPTNEPYDRAITGKLYDDEPDTRLRQELVLGLGGWRLLEALGLRPGACHLNEGHTGFVVLERARAAMRAHGLTFREALAATRAGNIFTTHTPVAAGIDAFPRSLLEKYFPDGRGYLDELGISFAELLSLGQAPGSAADESFRPTYLAIQGAGQVNAVSAAHGETSRRLFQPLFPRWPGCEIPIGHVTNGVHMPSWDSRVADALWTAACGPGPWRGTGEGLEQRAAAIDDQTLWDARGKARAELVRVARLHLARQLERRGGSIDEVEAAARTLDPDVLTLGFARRFAEYKRPNLLLSERDRLRRLLCNPRRPVQLVIAGKAHPDDDVGKALLREWTRFVTEPDMRTRCVFVEDYDLTVAQELVQGVDVWLNTPRPPWEACGTSGMKALVNGGLNLSVLDGWWAEAFQPDVGWALPGASDRADAQALYDMLEQDIVPCFYDRAPSGLPVEWLRRVRASLSKLTPRFSASRMVREYVQRLYRPAEAWVLRRLERPDEAREAAQFLDKIQTHWSALRLGRRDAQPTATGWRVTVEVYLDDLTAADVDVELYADPAPGEPAPVLIAMTPAQPLLGTSHGFLYEATIPGVRPPSHYTPRLRPARARLLTPLETPLISWH